METSKHNRLTDRKNGENRRKFTGRAGQLYLFDNGIAPYLSYSEFFSPSLYTGADGNPPALTEGVRHEAGIEHQTPGAKSLFSAALLHIEQDNVAVRGPNTFIHRPVGTIRSRRVELEGRMQLTDNFRLLAGYTFTNVTDKTSPNGKEGGTPSQIPKRMASCGPNTASPAVRLTTSAWAPACATRLAKLGLGAHGNPAECEQPVRQGLCHVRP